jgi:hypothetical protein
LSIYIRIVRSVSHSYATRVTSVSEKSWSIEQTGQTTIGSYRDLTASRSMKFRSKISRKRSAFSALIPVMGLLIAATLAKLGVAAQLIHLAH